VLAFAASIANVLFAYFLALRETRLWIASAAGIIVLLLSLFIAHSQPLHIVYGFLGSTLAAIAVLLLLYLRETRVIEYAKIDEPSTSDKRHHPRTQ
jgi:hypothetical protein